MKKGIQLGWVLMLGLPLQTLAKAGIATDGLEFMLVLAGFLLLLAAILKGTDYLMKNGKRLFQRVNAFIRKKIREVPPDSRFSPLRDFVRTLSPLR